MNQSYSADYVEARQQFSGISISDIEAKQLAKQFADTFSAMGKDDFLPAVKQLYANQVYFNDTLHLIEKKAELTLYFENMNQRVSEARVELLNSFTSGDSLYVHWTMHFSLEYLGSSKDVFSSGISELRYNEDKQIIFQQDFWDPNNGMIRQLPYVGSIFSKILPFKKG